MRCLFAQFQLIPMTSETRDAVLHRVAALLNQGEAVCMFAEDIDAFQDRLELIRIDLKVDAVTVPFSLHLNLSTGKSEPLDVVFAQSVSIKNHMLSINKL